MVVGDDQDPANGETINCFTMAAIMMNEVTQHRGETLIFDHHPFNNKPAAKHPQTNSQHKMTLRTLGPKAAAALDEELMSSGAFTIDQLMELAGLSVAQSQYRFSPPHKTRRLLIACGPGNNGGDGLVAARHLHHFGYQPSIYYPKQGKAEIYSRLRKQLEQLNIPFTDDFNSALSRTDGVIDAIFGFSFSGEVREPFPAVIEALAETNLPVLAVDAPSSWNIESGPPDSGPGKEYNPGALISLTAPKPLVKWFKGKHYIGGRFIGKEIADKYGFDVPSYHGDEQVVEVAITDIEGGKL